MTNKGVALGETTQIPFVSSAKLDPVFRGDLEEIDHGWDMVFQRRNQFLPKSQPHACRTQGLHESGVTSSSERANWDSTYLRRNYPLPFCRQNHPY